MCVCGAPSSLTSWSAAEGLSKQFHSLLTDGETGGIAKKRESCLSSLLPAGSGAEIVQDTDNSEERSVWKFPGLLIPP